ncbi:MAG: MFS transporter [Clostridia bacterium]|nr:MFS transporter [Clostridia bacterium]
MRKLHTKGQMFLYAISGMGVNMLNLMMGSYLCSAILVGGFGEAAVKNQTFEGHDLVIAALWAVFGLIAKIVDGIIDIPMASFTDRLKTRWGRRRPAIVIGMVPMILSFLAFLLWCPNPGAATLLNTVYYGIVLCIFYSSYTLTMVTYYATFTEIVDNEAGRDFISNVKAVFDIVYFILGYVVVSAMLGGLHLRVVGLIVLPLVLTMLIPLFMIKESREEIGATGSGETVNLIKSLVCTFRNRNYVIWMLVYSFMTFGVQLFLSGINEYFSKTGMSMIFVMIAAFGPVPLTLMLYNKLQRTKGFGFAFRYTLIIFALGMGAMFGVSFLEAGALKTVLSVCTGLISSFGIGALFSVAYSVPAQLAAEEEEKTGVSNSAMYFAVQGLFSGVATGIGGSVVLTALKGTEQHPTNNIIYLTLICAIAMLAACVLTWVLPKSIIEMGKKQDK